MSWFVLNLLCERSERRPRRPGALVAKFALAQRHAWVTQLISRTAGREFDRNVSSVWDEHDVLRVNHMSRYKALAELYDELKNIRVLDRVHDYATDADPISERAHEIRQRRRKQILNEIARLRLSRSERIMRAIVGSAVGFVSVAGYAMLLYFLK